MKWNTDRILIYISMIGHQCIDMCTIIYIYIMVSHDEYKFPYTHIPLRAKLKIESLTCLNEFVG